MERPTTPANEDTQEDKRTRRANWVVRAGVIVCLLLIAYVAQSILIPIIGAFLLSITLSPAVRWLSRRGVSRYISAFAFALIVSGLSLIVLVAFGSMIGGWIENAPQYMDTLSDRLENVRKPLEGLAEATDEAMDEPEETPRPRRLWGSLDQSQRIEPSPEADATSPSSQPFWLEMLKLALGQSLTIVTGFFICVTLTFFLLLSGDVFLAKLLSAFPNLSGKKEAMAIVREIEKEISHFLGMWTLINFCVGFVVWAGFQAIGIPNAWLWGIASMLFNYIPYAGPWVLGGFALVMGMLTYDKPIPILLPAGIILFVNVIEGFIISPMVHGKRLNLNTVSVFLAVILGGWLWGIAGALMAVPILVVVYVFCSHIESLQMIALFIDDSAPGLNRKQAADKGDVSSQATPSIGKSESAQ
ncbi:AI-2E family transporter [Phycisphaeraceae bacterium D3-23]